MRSSDEATTATAPAASRPRRVAATTARRYRSVGKRSNGPVVASGVTARGRATPRTTPLHNRSFEGGTRTRCGRPDLRSRAMCRRFGFGGGGLSDEPAGRRNQYAACTVIAVRGGARVTIKKGLAYLLIAIGVAATGTGLYGIVQLFARGITYACVGQGCPYQTPEAVPWIYFATIGMPVGVLSLVGGFLLRKFA